jgi:hypothetical protein
LLGALPPERVRRASGVSLVARGAWHAVCRLEAPAPVDSIAIDEGAPHVGQPITLAGYGLSGALAHAQSALRVVETAVVMLDAQSFDVGTEDHTP